MPEALFEVNNHPQCAALGRTALEHDLGPQHIQDPQPWMASESYALYLQKFPGVLTFTGIANKEEGCGANHHTPEFDIDERGLIYGTAMAISYALAFLNNPQPIKFTPNPEPGTTRQTQRLTKYQLKDNSGPQPLFLMLFFTAAFVAVFLMLLLLPFLMLLLLPFLDINIATPFYIYILWKLNHNPKSHTIAQYSQPAFVPQLGSTPPLSRACQPGYFPAKGQAQQRILDRKISPGPIQINRVLCF